MTGWEVFAGLVAGGIMVATSFLLNRRQLKEKRRLIDEMSRENDEMFHKLEETYTKLAEQDSDLTSTVAIDLDPGETFHIHRSNETEIVLVAPTEGMRIEIRRVFPRRETVRTPHCSGLLGTGHEESYGGP